jgi:serine/threonine protein kinase
MKMEFIEFSIEEYLALPKFTGKLAELQVLAQMQEALKELHGIGYIH